MIDINLIRHDFDKVRNAIINKNENADIKALQELDSRQRKLLHECEQLRHQRKTASKQISGLKPGQEEALALIKTMKGVSNEIKKLETEIKKRSEEIHDILLRIPNIPAVDVPVGVDQESNIEIRTWGEKNDFNFQPLPHWELGKSLDILDFERASKISGTGFTIYKGAGAMLERALYSFMLDLHIREHGYTEIIPPFLVNRASMIGTGQLPKLEEDMYKTSVDDLFLIPTGEVPVTNIHANEILSWQELPINYATYTACFRREAGSHGKDTRGMMRVHQFNKVELVKFVRPESSYQELESLVSEAEKVIQLLRLPYRIIKLCTGDLSFAATKCYDIEVWSPGVNKYLEVSSCSNFEDFQARRCSIRFRDEKGTLKFVHTLNGSGVALPRTMIAIMETYQQEDGTIEVPQVLRPYMGGLHFIKVL